MYIRQIKYANEIMELKLQNISVNAKRLPSQPEAG